MSDASVVFDTKFDNKGLVLGIRDAGRKLDTLTQKLARQNESVNKQKALVAELHAQYQKLVSGDVKPKSLVAMGKELERNQAKAGKLEEQIASLQQKLEASKDYKLPGWELQQAELDLLKSQLAQLDIESDKLARTMEQIRLDPSTSDEARKLAEQIGLAHQKLTRLQDEAKTTGRQIKKSMDSKPVREFTKDTKSASNAVTGFAGRIRRLVVAAFVFNVIRRGLVSLRNYLGGLLKTNAEFMASLSAVKVNLATAFQPIYEAILPALNALMSALATATAYIASFISMLFGKTYSESKAAAKALNQQAEALKKTGGAAKSASKQLFAFDQINQQITDTADGGGAGDAGLSALFEDVEEPKFDVPEWLQTALDIIDPTIEAFRELWTAMEPFKQFIWQGLKDFRDLFIVPFGTWFFADFIPGVLNGLQKISKDVDWTRLNGALATLWSALEPFVETIGAGLLWFYENVLVPFGTWALDSFLPAFFEAIASVIFGLDADAQELGEAFAWLWENGLKPLLGWVGDKILAFLEWVKDNGDLVAGILVGLGAAFLGFKIAGAIAVGIQALSAAVGGLGVALLGKGFVVIGAIVASLAIFNDLSPTMTANLSVLAGALVAFGIAMAGVSWPIALIAGVAAGIATFALAMQKDCIPAVERFDDSISEATQNAVTPFMDMLDETTLALRELAATGEEITDEMVETIVGNYRRMREQAIDEITRQRDETLDNLRYIFQEEAAYFEESITAVNAAYDEKIAALQNNTELTKEEYAEQLAALQEQKNAEILALGEGTDATHQAYLQRLTDTEQHYADKAAAVTAAEEDLRQSMKEQLVSGETLNQESLDKLLEQQDTFFVESMGALVSDADERESVINKRNENEELLAKHHVSAILAEAARERDEVIAAANEKYDGVYAKAEELRKVGTDEAIAMADSMIEQAERDRDKSIRIAEEKYNGIVDKATDGMGELDTEIDLANGRIKTKWEDFWNGIGAWFKGLWEGITSWFGSVWDKITGKTAAPASVTGSTTGSAARSFADLPGFEYAGGDIQIPALATGGIIDDATIAMIGERGREAVLPLDRNTQWMDTLAAKIANLLGQSMAVSLSAAGANSASNTVGDVTMNIDGARLARLTAPALVEELRRLGLLPT